METVKLKNGQEESAPLVVATMMSLESMLTSLRGATKFYDLVMVARNGAYRPFNNTGQELQDAGLLGPDGKMHASIRNIILSAVSGDGLTMQLGSPIAQVVSNG